MMNKGYYNGHLPHQGTFVPVLEEPIYNEREVEDEDLKEFILGLDIPDEEKAEALAAYGIENA